MDERLTEKPTLAQRRQYVGERFAEIGRRVDQIADPEEREDTLEQEIISVEIGMRALENFIPRRSKQAITVKKEENDG